MDDKEAKLKQDIGFRVKELRTRRGQSMDSFAAMIGSTSATVSNIENGKSIPGGAILLNMAKACSVTTDWILTGEEPEQEALRETAGKQIFFRGKWQFFSRLNNGYMNEEEMRIHLAVFNLLENVEHLSSEDIQLLSSVAARMMKESGK